MELLPCDCLKLICNFIRDKDFIHLILSSKYLYSLIKYNLKIMTEQHKLSKMNNVKDIYVFTHILYDLTNFDHTKIPHTIIEITFCDEFNEKFNELCNFKNLNKINIGMHYSNKQLLNNFSDTINKKEIAKTMISNRVFMSLFNNVNNKLDWFAINFKHMYDSAYNNYNELKTKIENAKIPAHLDFILVSTVNTYINKENKYEFHYYRKNIKQIIDGFDDYVEFLKFHIDMILKNLTKLKNTMCEKHENIRNEFLEV